MTEDVNHIELGKQAWQRLRDRDRKAWADWLEVGKALKIGKDAAMLAAKAKSPHGRTYVRMFGAWLRETGFDKVLQSHRYRLLQCIANIDEIEAWRAGLDETTRDKYNHPDAVWFAWRRAVHKEPPVYTRPYRPPNQSGKHVGGRYSRPLYFDQDVIKRVAVALREHWCSDTYKLAVVVLNAAFPTEDALRELLPVDRPKPAPRLPKPTAAPIALEIHA
jgi:hypothetical protein